MANGTIFCSRCGTPNAASWAFCQQCGCNLGTGVTGPTAVTTFPSQGAVGVPTVSPYGGFWIRVLALLIDRIALGVVLGPLYAIFVLPVILSAARGEMENGPPPWFFAMLAMCIVVAIGIQWLYDALLTSSSWQATVGKKLLRLKVSDMAGNRISFARATGRFFGRMLSGMACYIGFIMVAFTERKQGLHDMIAGTLVWKA